MTRAADQMRQRTVANPAAAVLYPSPVQMKAIRGLDYCIGGYIQMFKALVI